MLSPCWQDLGTICKGLAPQCRAAFRQRVPADLGVGVWLAVKPHTVPAMLIYIYEARVTSDAVAVKRPSTPGCSDRPRCGVL
jgi:hypothetical protein